MRAISFGGGEEGAARLAVASRCIDVISGHFGNAESKLYRHGANGAPEEATTNALYKLLLNGTPAMSAQELKRRLMESYLTHGEAFAVIKWDNNGLPVDIVPYDFPQVTVEMTGNGHWNYFVRDFLSANAQRPISHTDMFHGKHRPFLERGRSPLALACESMGYGAALNEALKNAAEQGFKGAGVLSAPGTITDATAKRLKDDLEAKFYGPNGAGRVMVAGDGLEYKAITQTGADAEALESKRLSMYEIAAAFGLPPEAVGLPFHSSWSSSEQAGLQLVAALKMWEGHLLGQLVAFCLSPTVRAKVWASSDYSYLTAGSMSELATSVSTLINAKVFTPDEIRARFYDVGPLADGSGSSARKPQPAPTASPVATQQPVDAQPAATT